MLAREAVISWLNSTNTRPEAQCNRHFSATFKRSILVVRLDIRIRRYRLNIRCTHSREPHSASQKSRRKHPLNKAKIHHAIRLDFAGLRVLHLDEPELAVGYTVPTMCILLGLAIERDEAHERTEIATAVLEALINLVLVYEESLAALKLQQEKTCAVGWLCQEELPYVLAVKQQRICNDRTVVWVRSSPDFTWEACRFTWSVADIDDSVFLALDETTRWPLLNHVGTVQLLHENLAVLASSALRNDLRVFTDLLKLG